jgi:hypothetical protein
MEMFKSGTFSVMIIIYDDHNKIMYESRRQIKWLSHVARKGGMRLGYKRSVGETEGNVQLERNVLNISACTLLAISHIRVTLTTLPSK